MSDAVPAHSTAGVAGNGSATPPTFPVGSPMRSDHDTVGGPSSSSAQPARHEREITGVTPVPSQKKIRTEADELNPSPMRSGYYRPAIGTAVRQPPIPEDSDNVAPVLPTYQELVERDEQDEAAAQPSEPRAAVGHSPSESRGSRSERGRARPPRSGARSGSRQSSRSMSTVSVRVACWDPGPNCPPTAENRCPGKAHKPGGPCGRPVCNACSGSCHKCSVQWLCEDCIAFEA